MQEHHAHFIGNKTVIHLQLEGLLEEMLMLCQRGEEYNQFMLSRVAEAFHPKVTPPGHENAFRTGAFNTSIRELTSYYINIVSLKLSEKQLKRKVAF